MQTLLQDQNDHKKFESDLKRRELIQREREFEQKIQQVKERAAVENSKTMRKNREKVAEECTLKFDEELDARAEFVRFLKKC